MKKSKVCGWCRKRKPVSGFYRHVTNSDKLQGHCKRCHNEWRMRVYFQNTAKERAASKKWALANPDKVRSYWKASNLNHRDKRNKTCREWRRKYPERQRKAALRWYRENADKVRLNARIYYHERRDRYLKKMKAWKAANPGLIAKSNNRRRTSEARGGPFYSSEEWISLCRKYGGICLRCKRKRKLTADHVIPVSRGGANGIVNIQPLCITCNQSKSVKLTDFRKEFEIAKR